MNAILRLRATDTDRQAMMADAAALLEIALAVQGPGALSATRDHAAHHEAGHAIQFKVEGHHVLGVEVYRRGADWLGQSVVAGPGWRVDGATDPQADLSRARILLAGPLAELLHCARPALGAGVDEIALARSIAGTAASKLSVDGDPLLIGIVCEVIATFNRHRPAFDGLAAALMLQRKVKGFKLMRILDPIECSA